MIIQSLQTRTDARHPARIALIYLHLEPEQGKFFHRQAVNALKPGAHVIFEAFSKEQIRNISGGPGKEKLLYRVSELEDDFKGLVFSVSRQKKVRLNEGPFHQGKALVIRILATKILITPVVFSAV